MPKRVQLRRAAGWRLRDQHPAAVNVARPTKWGNPFKLNSPMGLARVPAVHYPDQEWEYEGRISSHGQYHPYVFGENVPDHPQLIRNAMGAYVPCHVRYMTPAEAVQCYRAWITGGGWPIDWAPRNCVTVEDARRELAGRDLACWCPLDQQPCHADVLLELANTKADSAL